jgi:2-polyprenyl-3-methyl-5-hydroxy-6-metoxy-1,4-benzoquinol methylase
VDFGCGSTAFLDRAAKLGWSPVGVDFTPTVVEAVRAVGHEAYLVDESWEAIGAGTVHALRLNHVLEHLYDPWDTMRRLADLLSDGGRIHIAVPNPAGVSARWFGRDWNSFDARHTILYSPVQAMTFLEELGFTDVRGVHETVAKDIVRSWGYRRARQGRMPRQNVESLAGNVELNALATPLAKVAAVLRRADRFHLFASK